MVCDVVSGKRSPTGEAKDFNNLCLPKLKTQSTLEKIYCDVLIGLKGHHNILISRMTDRHCKRCETVKPLSEFSCCTKNGKIYHRTSCKPCESNSRKEDQKAYREANKEKIAAKKKEYVENNRDKVNEHRREYKNRPEVKEKSKVKVVCSICGTEIRKDGLKRHMTNHDPKKFDSRGLRIY